MNRQEQLAAYLAQKSSRKILTNVTNKVPSIERTEPKKPLKQATLSRTATLTSRDTLKEDKFETRKQTKPKMPHIQSLSMEEKGQHLHEAERAVRGPPLQISSNSSDPFEEKDSPSIINLRIQIDAQQQTIDTLRILDQSLKTEIRKLKVTLEDTQAQLETKQLEIIGSKSEHENEIRELKSEKADLESVVNDKIQLIQELDALIIQLRREVENSNSKSNSSAFLQDDERDAYEQCIALLESQLKDKDQQVTQQSGENIVLKSALTACVAENKQIHEHSATLEAELAEAHSVLQEMTEAYKDGHVEELESKVLSYGVDLKNATQELDDTKVESKRLGEALSTVLSENRLLSKFSSLSEFESNVNNQYVRLSDVRSSSFKVISRIWRRDCKKSSVFGNRYPKNKVN